MKVETDNDVLAVKLRLEYNHIVLSFCHNILLDLYSNNFFETFIKEWK